MTLCLFITLQINLSLCALERYDIKGKGKVHPITGHEGREVWSRGIALLFL